MNGSNHHPLVRPSMFSLSVALLLLGAPLAFGDSLVWKGIASPNVTITKVKDGEIFYTSGTATEVHKPLSEITKITITTEPNLTTAEDAYAKQEWTKAAAAYKLVVDKTPLAWLKNWASIRLVESANKIEPPRIDLVCTGLIPLIQADPKSAATIELIMPKADSGFLDDAIKQAKAALGLRPKPDVELPLLNLLYKLQSAKGDIAGSDETLAQVLKLDPSNKLALDAAIHKSLISIQTDFAAKQYDKVIAAVEGAEGQKFTIPADQADALFLRAKSLDAKAAASTKVEDWKDVALAYLQVASNFPGDVHAGESLLRTADILEKQVKDADEAKKLYKQIATDPAFTGPVATEAKKHL